MKVGGGQSGYKINSDLEVDPTLRDNFKSLKASLAEETASVVEVKPGNLTECYSLTGKTPSQDWTKKVISWGGAVPHEGDFTATVISKGLQSVEHLANESSCRFDGADSDFEAGENAFKVSLHCTVQQEIIHDLLTNLAKFVIFLF